MKEREVVSRLYSISAQSWVEKSDSSAVLRVEGYVADGEREKERERKKKQEGKNLN